MFYIYILLKKSQQGILILVKCNNHKLISYETYFRVLNNRSLPKTYCVKINANEDLKIVVPFVPGDSTSLFFENTFM